MEDLRLLWINFTRSQTPPEVLRELGANFTVNWLPGAQALDESVLPSEPCIACFDFRSVYEDDKNSVLVKNSPHFAGLIAQHGKHRDETK